jgi:D-3-phosphoglycerate dehydrogenase
MKVLVTEPLAEEGIELLKSTAEVDVRLKMPPEELRKTVADYDALIVRSETKVTEEVIECGRKLQVIARAGVGVDNIDVEAATRRGIVVVNAPTGNTVSAAEHTLALLLSLARHIPRADALLKSGVWRRSDLVGIELRNKVLGIIGLGNVGSEVARRARGFQMRLIAYDPFVSPDYARNLGVELVTLEYLLSESDFITLHLPLTPQTRNLIGAKELSRVKPTVRIVNCARGGLIDEVALYQAIQEGRVAGAALDVFNNEPVTDHPLFKCDGVVVTPHLGASTAEAQAGVAMDIAEQIIAIFRGKPARYAVNAPFISPELFAVLAPFINLATLLGRLVSQLIEGQMSALDVGYEGEIASYNTDALKAAVIGGLLERISDVRVNLVNAGVIAAQRGLRVTERKETVCENYSSLLTVSVVTDQGVTTVAGTVMRGEPHIVRVNSYWIDLALTGGYFLFSDHRDRPGLIGAVGTITGNADVNISFMQLSRLKPRGQALMVLGLDEPINEEQRQQILALPDVYTAKLVKL